MAKNSADYTQLFEEYVGIVGEKQILLDGHVSGLEWDLDPRKELLMIGETYRVIVQVLGTYTFDSAEWLWVWGNEMFTYPDPIREDSLKLKAYGEEYGIAQFSTPSLALTEAELYQLAITAVGVAGDSFYYLGNYGTGAALLAARSTLMDLSLPETKTGMLFPRILARYPIENHKNAFVHYTQKKGFTVTEGDCVTAVKEEVTLTACFDAANKLVKLNTEKSGGA